MFLSKFDAEPLSHACQEYEVDGNVRPFCRFACEYDLMFLLTVAELLFQMIEVYIDRIKWRNKSRLFVVSLVRCYDHTTRKILLLEFTTHTHTHTILKFHAILRFSSGYIVIILTRCRTMQPQC